MAKPGHRSLRTNKHVAEHGLQTENNTNLWKWCICQNAREIFAIFNCHDCHVFGLSLLSFILVSSVFHACIPCLSCVHSSLSAHCRQLFLFTIFEENLEAVRYKDSEKIDRIIKRTLGEVTSDKKCQIVRSVSVWCIHQQKQCHLFFYPRGPGICYPLIILVQILHFFAAKV